MTSARRRNHLTTYFSERIPVAVVKRRISVNPTAGSTPSTRHPPPYRGSFLTQPQQPSFLAPTSRLLCDRNESLRSSPLVHFQDRKHRMSHRHDGQNISRPDLAGVQYIVEISGTWAETDSLTYGKINSPTSITVRIPQIRHIPSARLWDTCQVCVAKYNFYSYLISSFGTSDTFNASSSFLFTNVRRRHDDKNYTVINKVTDVFSGVPPGGVGVFKPPYPETPKALQNRAKLNPIVKTVKNCWI